MEMEPIYISKPQKKYKANSSNYKKKITLALKLGKFK